MFRNAIKNLTKFSVLCVTYTNVAKIVLSVLVVLVALYYLPVFKYRLLKSYDHFDKMSVSKEVFLIKPTVKATASVIFLHGLGDNGSGWYHAFDELKKNNVRYIFPNAPSMPVALNGGFVMPSWFDLKGLNPNDSEDEKGIKSAAEKIRRLIKAENDEHGIPCERIVLGGFSMGGALALYTALTHPEQLAGVVGLSSWLPLHKSFIAGHGDADPMVPPEFGKLTHNLLQKGREGLASVTTFKSYRGMGHQSSDEEMDDVKQFVDKYLA